jgi:hypothetical protein
MLHVAYDYLMYLRINDGVVKSRIVVALPVELFCFSSPQFHI